MKNHPLRHLLGRGLVVGAAVAVLGAGFAAPASAAAPSRTGTASNGNCFAFQNGGSAVSTCQWYDPYLIHRAAVRCISTLNQWRYGPWENTSTSSVASCRGFWDVTGIDSQESSIG